MIPHLVQSLWVMLALCVVSGIGYVWEHTLCGRLYRRLDACTEYANTFASAEQAYLGHSFDAVSHNWLLLRLGEMEIELGSEGVVSYKPPFANYIHTQYRMLTNTLVSMRTGAAHEHDVLAVHDILVAHIGLIKHVFDTQQRALRNPALWLRTGIRVIVISPLLVLRWFGLLSKPTFNTLSSSWLTRVMSFMLAVVGLVGSIVTIVLGWSGFLHLLHL